MTVGILFAILCVLSAADCWTTYTALKSGKGKELNVFLSWLMGKIGVVQALTIIKAVFLLLMYAYGMNFIALGIAVVGYVAVVVNNLLVLRKISQSS